MPGAPATSAVLGDLTWPEAQKLAEAGGVLAVPIGSTEQHGPHLPLSTDTDVAMALAGRLARARPDVVVAPPLCYGSSGEHAGFAGTISIGQEALELLLVEFGRSASQTFRHQVFISAHGGNHDTVTRVAARLRTESRDILLWVPGIAHPAADPHAGRDETSIQLALDASRVRAGLAEPGNLTPLKALMPVLRAGGVRAASRSGVLGDPSGASAAEGEQILDQLATALAAAVRAWRGEEGG
ncbi:MAG TPA: mycofactocin biosynthesis peptidyl-dipeptidase MftE [Streptosporangiaceae bacterium]|nr:mycofactocin biosynthesis peptidyl-dipeptidase MftE [Streptosporangiaceae bacterium]